MTMTMIVETPPDRIRPAAVAGLPAAMSRPAIGGAR
jgi:hypothetical protein